MVDFRFHRASLSEARPAVDKILERLTPRQREVAARPLGEISERIDFLLAVGLGYLSLERSAATLSGGEAQRIRLATQIGSRLRGVLYVLDEPSIGLHARDNDQLLHSLEQLRNLGNTVLVVEHDEDTIRRADYVVDLGPGAGDAGGYLVASGRPEEIAASKESLTGQYLSGITKIEVPTKRRSPNGKAIQILGARTNNLKDVDVSFSAWIIYSRHRCFGLRKVNAGKRYSVPRPGSETVPVDGTTRRLPDDPGDRAHRQGHRD